MGGGKGGASSRRNPNRYWSRAFGATIAAVALFLSLGSYYPNDPSFNTLSEDWKTPKNVLGYLGSWTADGLFQILGFSAWVLPSLLLIAVGRWVAQDDKQQAPVGKRGLIALAITVLAGVLAFDWLYEMWGVLANNESFPPQGLAGLFLGSATRPIFGTWGTFIVVLSLGWFFCMVWWESLPAYIGHLVVKAGAYFTVLSAKLVAKVSVTLGRQLAHAAQGMVAQVKREKKELAAENAAQAVIRKEAVAVEEDDEDDSPTPTTKPIIRMQAQETPPERVERRPAPPAAPKGPRNWTLPPLSLLKVPKVRVKGPTAEELQQTALKISETLKSFEIYGEISEISPGPIVTMYEFIPAPGVRVQKIKAAATDLAMTLGAQSVRVLAPVPGKPCAGIEVPNAHKDAVVLRDVFEATMDKASKQKLPIVLGKDAEGNSVVEDLARMPHLLVGGATNMGKSVFVNSVLVSLLCRFTPDELRIVIVDPKLVEFKSFENIPHLLLPIVNDPNDASQALKWAVVETRRRYQLLQKFGAKNIQGYNEKVAELKGKDQEGEPLERLSYIVIIIDELAELMMCGKKDVEQSIVRLTQLARAAGLHLVMATQRPSADVVTGLIKSNCPSRAALRVASANDSRIIMDCSGAEQLLGNGDMIFSNSGPMGLRRIQGSYISDEEIEQICNFWSDQGEPEFQDDILAPESGEEPTANLDPSERDPLWNEVVSFAREKGKISTSLIQRRFQIGYTRAARIMEQLEGAGMVAEQSAAGKARDVIA